jgi:hypothetical protein
MTVTSINHIFVLTNCKLWCLVNLLKNVANFLNLGTKVTNQNDIHEEINRTLNSGNACYHSVESLSYRLLYKKFKN